MEEKEHVRASCRRGRCGAGIGRGPAPTDPNRLEVGKPQDGVCNGMVVWGVKQGTLARGSRNVGHINLPAVETAFGGNGNRRQRKFLLEQENKT